MTSKQIYTVATINGFKHSDVIGYIALEYGVTSTKDLSEEEKKSLLNYLDKDKQTQSKENNEVSSLNKAMIIGNLGKDPELKYMPNGKAVSSFSVATSSKWKDQDGNQQEKTEWHNVTAFEKLAEIVGEYLEKGSKVYIEGKLQTDTWEKDGVKHYSTKIIASQMVMLGGNKEKIDATPEEQKRESEPAF